ncbi:MAG: SUMF1/EgtB/PvdO family nonheme iron enzyme [Myxococcota bacterium]
MRSTDRNVRTGWGIAIGASALAVLSALACDPVQDDARRSGSEDASAEITRADEAAAPAIEPARVAIAGGPFVAGCDPARGDDCLPDEIPSGVREVEAFAIDRTEVTVAAYRACVEAGACTPPDVAESCNWAQQGRERHPINCVDWEQAKAYCAFRGARLPTEWEWEKAARGSEGRRNPWGDAPADCRLAVIDEGGGNACGAGDTTFEVGSRPAGATPEGILDLIGNVWEWTATVRENGRAPVVRGAAYYSEPGHARASHLLRFNPIGRGPFVGFRCAS